MTPVIRRTHQLAVQGPDDVFWLVYSLCIAPWLHRASVPMHALLRLYGRRRRNLSVERRADQLRQRFARGLHREGRCRIALAELSPDLERICAPLRNSSREIPLGDVDQDGFVLPRYPFFWDVPRVSPHLFLPRARFTLTIVDRDGWVGLRKHFRGDKTAFVNELEASVDLIARGCNVPGILHVDFDDLSITFCYIHGPVVREALAQAGALLRDRDVPEPRGIDRLRRRQLEKRRAASSRRLLHRVLDRETIENIATCLLSVHRAGYTLEDIKYGNIIIESTTNTPYFVDLEHALPLSRFPRATGIYIRDRDATKVNELFGTDLLTAVILRRSRSTPGTTIYAPFCAGSGAIWNPDFGMQRWRYIVGRHVSIPRGGRVLYLGANNGFNALQMLRSGASEVVALEIDPLAIAQGLFVKRIFEWAGNVDYRLSYVLGSHCNIASMKLGRFDLVTALSTLSYLSGEEMARTVSGLAEMTDTLVLQCNDATSIKRSDPATSVKASLRFNVELVRSNGFPHVEVIERSGSYRPLIVARQSGRERIHGSRHADVLSESCVPTKGNGSRSDRDPVVVARTTS